MAVHVRNRAEHILQIIEALMQCLVKAGDYDTRRRCIQSRQRGKISTIDEYQTERGDFIVKQRRHPRQIQRRLIRRRAPEGALLKGRGSGIFPVFVPRRGKAALEESRHGLLAQRLKPRRGGTRVLGSEPLEFGGIMIFGL